MKKLKTKQKKQTRTELLINYLVDFINRYKDAPPSPLPYSNPWRLLRYSGPWEKLYKSYKYDRLRRDLDRLKERGLISYRTIGPKIQIEIKPAGYKFHEKFNLNELEIKIPSKWDKIWRVVIFDIPEKQRRKRTLLRMKLREWGFVQVQQSTWVFPYKCESQVAALCKAYDLRKYVTLFEGKYLGNDSRLKKEFNL